MNGNSGTAAYGYLADSGLLDHVSTDSGLITSYTYEDHRDVKTSVSNAFNTALASSYAYEYDAMGRRTSVANTGGAFAEPGLEFRGQEFRGHNTKFMSSKFWDRRPFLSRNNVARRTCVPCGFPYPLESKKGEAPFSEPLPARC